MAKITDSLFKFKKNTNFVFDKFVIYYFSLFVRIFYLSCKKNGGIIILKKVWIIKGAT